MKLEYVHYLPNGEIARKCRINFLSLNKYNYYNLYEKFSENHTWYTKYDLKQNRYYKFHNITDTLIAEGDMKNGYFHVGQDMHRELLLEKQTTYLGFEAIQVIEKINTGEHRIVALHNSCVNDFVETDFIYKLPISSRRTFGQRFKDYGIIASRETKYSSSYIKMFEITRIYD